MENILPRLTAQENRTSAPRNLYTNNGVEKVNTGKQSNARARELYMRDLLNETTADGETVYAAPLYAHFTTKQIGMFLTELPTRGFEQAFKICMAHDGWKDEEQIQLLCDLVKDCTALLAVMTKGQLKAQTLQRIKSVADEYFRPTLNS